MAPLPGEPDPQPMFEGLDCFTGQMYWPPAQRVDTSLAAAARIKPQGARLKAATPGHWYYVQDTPMFMGTADEVRGTALDIRGRAYRQEKYAANGFVEPDAQLIAHAPDDLRFLLDLVDLKG